MYNVCNINYTSYHTNIKHIHTVFVSSIFYLSHSQSLIFQLSFKHVETLYYMQKEDCGGSALV